VVLTTSNAEMDIIKVYELHANAYITKPLDFDQLTKVIESIVNFWLAILRLSAK
jgi:DNA-binding response OmpR family regulator